MWRNRVLSSCYCVNVEQIPRLCLFQRRPNFFQGDPKLRKAWISEFRLYSCRCEKFWEALNFKGTKVPQTEEEDTFQLTESDSAHLLHFLCLTLNFSSGSIISTSANSVAYVNLIAYRTVKSGFKLIIMFSKLPCPCLLSWCASPSIKTAHVFSRFSWI